MIKVRSGVLTYVTNGPTSHTTSSQSTALSLVAESTRRYIRTSKSENTLRAYKAAWKGFQDWYSAVIGTPIDMPATPATVAAFLASEADRGLSVATIQARAAAIAFTHKVAGHHSPTSHPDVTAVLAGIARSCGSAQKQATAATAEIVKIWLDHIPLDTLSGKRNRALIALGFAGAFRRSELAALQVKDLRLVVDGLDVYLSRSKTDQAGQGVIVPVLRAGKVEHCPVVAVRSWLDAASITAGPVFLSISKAGRVGDRQISTRSIADIVKDVAKQAGHDPELFSPHSLRAGFVTSAATNGRDAGNIARITRHKKLETVQRYIRHANRYTKHAGNGLL